ncbi:apolipoprotein N-acyltransferase [Candidatus Magnetominusculus xianensis]|uniref:Apolipoprotein N-acyltransferase n=1 Tax=Candidatus Magnetominusculus xianensis TaxID=1748249 RepID=A0ABR5SEI7_9BACT|nr:apolipoprotein N-acyltransferase [Candidatus Magnetominusculus xianensis]KWT84425.1 apolipoprotein N-acyltransferase [Candidatus Magnetominusculus xianensis]MBF0404259.1 apolipoprotein N-acyltransferase [Nitrospirota bacterium]
MKNINNILTAYFPPVFTGVLLYLSFPMPDISFLAWVALVPLLYTILHSNGHKYSFKAGAAAGVVYFFLTQYWISHSIHNYGRLPLPLSLSAVLLLSAYQSIYTGLFGMALHLFIKRTKVPVYICAPSLWVGLEYFRGTLFTGFPWSFLGYTQYKVLPLIQIADITGVYGVSFLIVFFNAIIADFIIKDKISFFKRLMPFALFAVVIAAVLMYGYRRLNMSVNSKLVRVSVIQGNVAQEAKWDKKFTADILNSYKTMTKKAADDGAKLVVWPESSLPFLFGSDKVLTEELISFQKGLGIYLVLGTDLVKDYANGRYTLTNSAVVLEPGGKILNIYDKIHLVPFGEYVPLRNVLFFIDKLVTGIGDFKQGNALTVVKTPLGDFAAPICYEIAFPELVGAFYKYGGDFIVTITNDAWFGRTSGPYQHFIMAVFRAVESRKPVVRSANTGVSGFIDSTGAITAKSEIFEKAVLTKDIYTNQTITFYSLFGSVFAYVCNVINMAIIVKIFRTRRRPQ